MKTHELTGMLCIFSSMHLVMEAVQGSTSIAEISFKDFLCICGGIIVPAETDLLASCLQRNTEPVAATILLLQRISELGEERTSLLELEMGSRRTEFTGRGLPV